MNCRFGSLEIHQGKGELHLHSARGRIATPNGETMQLLLEEILRQSAVVKQQAEALSSLEQQLHSQEMSLSSYRESVLDAIKAS